MIQYTLVSGTIAITGEGDDDDDDDDDGDAKRADKGNKGVIFKTCARFTNGISNISNTQMGNAEYIDVVMPMFNLIEYSDNYSITLGSLWQYYRIEPNASITESESFKSKIKIT